MLTRRRRLHANRFFATRRWVMAIFSAFVLLGTPAGILGIFGAFASPIRPHGATTMQVEARYVQDAILVTAAFGWRLTSDALAVTRDGGTSWTGVTPSGLQPGQVRAVSFLDAYNGWLIASGSGGSSGFVCYRTVDGGVTWLSSPLGSSPTAYSDSSSSQASVDFLNVSDGWVEVQLPSSAAFSRGTLFRTQDGGITWTQLNTPPIMGEAAFASPSDGWLAGGVGGASLYSTTDGGETWTAGTPPLPAGASQSQVSYSITHSAGILGLRASLGGNSGLAALYSDTSPDNWSLLKTLPDSALAGAGRPTPPPVAVTSSGALATVVNGGTETAIVETSGQATTSKSDLPSGWVDRLSFADSNNGWAIMRTGTCLQFKTDCTEYSDLYATSDGGAAWMRLGG